MLRKSRIAAMLGVIVVLASACGNGDTPLSPASAPALNGGVPIGGANVVDPPADREGPASSTASTPDSSEEDASRAGGVPIGGAN